MRKLAVLLTLLFAAQCLAQTNCGVTLRDTKNKKAYKYDLTTLYHAPGLSDTLYYRDKRGNYFYVNFCGTTTTSCTTGSAVCQRASNYHYGCGALSTQKMLASNASDITVSSGLMVIYTGGDACSGGPERSTVIHVACSKTASPGFFYDAQEDNCAYVLRMWSVAGCPTEVPYGDASSSSVPSKKGMGVGGILLIIIFCCVIVYLVVGVIFQWKVRNAQTAREMIPNNEFWFALPLLVKDGVLFIAHGFKRGDYTSI